MTIRKQVVFEWHKRESLRFPPSWTIRKSTKIPMVIFAHDVNGCVMTYLQLEAGQKLDDERIDILGECLKYLKEARLIISDEEGKIYLELYIRLSELVLMDVGKETDT